MTAARALLPLVLLLPACDSCGAPGASPGPSGVTVAQTATSGVSADADASSPTAAPSSGATSSSPRAKRFADLRAGFPDEPPWRSGEGVVCGAAICKKGELCCDDGADPKCMPRAREKECMKKRGVAALCDESSDCSAHERCCYGHTDDGDLVTCATAKRCSVYWDRPGGYMMPAKEICARGGTCKTPDTVCVPAPKGSAVSGGQCVSAKSHVACESKADCPDDRPWCFWDREAKKGECIPRGPWRGEDGVFECDDHGDCPGGLCCGSSEQSFCSAGACDPGLAYAAIMCHTAKDCGQNPGNVPVCGGDESLPNGLGTCGWAPAPQ